MWNRFAPLATIAVLASALCPAPAQAARGTHNNHHTFGIGIALGEPTAIDFKWRPSHFFGFNAGVGVHHFADNLAAYADFEFTLVSFDIKGGGPTGGFYLGPGLQLGVANGSHHHGFKKHHDASTYLGIMMPIGVEFTFPFPLEIFVELRPGFVVIESIAFDIGGQVGFRAGW